MGRAAELDTLRGLWAQVAAGGGARLALVAGDAGMGKTRLSHELARHAHEEGAIVLHGTANEDLLMPHQHIVEALGHLLSVAAPEELRRRIEPRAADLEPVAPNLPVADADPDRADSPRESKRYRLFEAVAGLLEELAADAPVLLLIDDLHWADQSTAVLLRHVLESRPGARLLVLATQRPGEGASEAQAEALQRLSQGQFVERVPLEGLAPDDIRRLSQSVTGRDLSPELARAIHAETLGNPFFAQEFVRHLDESDRGASVLSLARGDVPERVREVVNLRLVRLSDACLRLLKVAAVMGTDFEPGLLEQVSDLQGEDLDIALDEALAAGVLVEADSGEHELFSFSHALMRRTLLGRVTRTHRRRIHARVAEALEASRGDEALLEIAHHLCEARPVSDRERALDYATRAAERATNGLAYAEAVDLFTRARLLLPPDDPRRRRLALKRAIAYQALFHAVYDSSAGATHATG